MQPVGPPSPLRLQVFSQFRSGSNLFCKMFSEHPMMQQHLSEITHCSCFGPEAHWRAKLDNPVNDQMAQFHPEISNRTYQNSLDKIEQAIAEAEKEGKIPFLKECSSHVTDATEVQKMLIRRRETTAPKPVMVDHQLDIAPERRNLGDGIPYDNQLEEPFNPTVLPSRLMKTLAPILIIRHPVKQVESWYRSAMRIFGSQVDNAEFELCASYRFSRRIFDYYKALYGQGSAEPSGRRGKWPLVIDGDDVVNDPEGTAKKFCAVTGLDPNGVIYKWERKGWFGNQGPIEYIFFGTLSNSEGVQRNLYPKKPDLAVSAAKWRKEWGEEVGNGLVQYVKDSMADYEYLYQFRL